MRSASLLLGGALIGLTALIACGVTVDTSPTATAPTITAPDAGDGGRAIEGTDASIPEDAGTGPVRVRLASLFTVDVILNRADGGYDQAQSSVDGSNYVLLTQSAETALFNDMHAALPDNGFFPGNADHPDVQLDYENGDFGLNARRLEPPGDGVTIPLPARALHRLQVLGISTEGTTTLTATIGYLDGLPSTETVTFDDWGKKQPGRGAFVLAGGLDRASINDAKNPYADRITRGFVVSGLNLTPDPSRKARDLTITCNATSLPSTRFHLLGIAGD